MSKRRIKRRPQKMTDEEVCFGIGWYREADWARLREISTDREDLEETYDEWLYAATKTFENLKQAGLPVEKVELDVEALHAWCRAEGIPVDGAARSNYVIRLQSLRDR